MSLDVTEPTWLALDPPAGWVVVAERGRRAARPPGVELVLEWHPLELLPDRQKAWVDSVLLAGLPAGGRYEGLGAEVTHTRTGWQVMLVGARVHLPAGPPEVRLGAFYAFLDHGGRALVRATDEAAFEAHGPAIRDALLGGRPDFAGAFAALEDFWSGLDDVAAELTRPKGR